MSTRAGSRIAFVTDSLFGFYQSGLLKAFERAALQRGHHVLAVIGRGLGHADPAERAQNVVYEWLAGGGVDGVVLLSSTLMNFGGALEGVVNRLHRMPMVSVGAKLSRMSSITVDNRGGMRAAVDHMIAAHDCRRIGYLAGPPDNPESGARLEGYRYALEARLLAFDPSLVEHGPFTIEGGRTAMQRLLARGRVFDAIVAAADMLAVGARPVLEARGLSVPDRVRLVAFDDSPVAVSEQLSSVAQPFNQLALRALDALEDAMAGRPPRDFAFSPRLALRQSCGCCQSGRGIELPALAKGQSAAGYLAARRSQLADCLQEINAACFDWWSSHSERLLLGVEAAVAGRDAEFLSTLDELVADAFGDGVPIEQIGRSLTRLYHQLQGATQKAELDRVWSRALSQLTSALGRTQQKSRVEGLARSSALRDATLRIWGVEDERELARCLAGELMHLGVKRAYLGLIAGSERDKLRPCLQVDGTGSVQHDGPTHPVRQLLPPGLLSSGTPSAWLVGAVNFGPQVTGIWACDGATDVVVFEQLRTEIGAVLQLFAMRRALALEPPGVPAPQRLEPNEALTRLSGTGPDAEEPTLVFSGAQRAASGLRRA